MAPVAPTSSGSPKVELISRGWDDVVDIETVVLPANPLDDDLLTFPIPAGGIEITVDSVTIIEEPVAEPEPDLQPAIEPEPVTDSWDHLRPHGELPPLRHKTTVSARVSQMATMLVALSALVAAGLRFFLNTRIDAFGNGRVDAQAVRDAERLSDIGLLIVVGLAIVALASLIWWLLTAYDSANFQPGPAGIVAALSAVAGSALVAVFYFAEPKTVSEALGANSLIVLGLGLLMMACLATVRTVGRIDLLEPV